MKDKLICKIDGDFYSLCVPTLRIWQSMAQSRISRPEVKNLLSLQCPLLGIDSGGPFFIWSSAPKIKDPSGIIDMKDYILWQNNYGTNVEWILTPGQPLISKLCLMLVPLNSKQEEIKEIFQRENPNGLIVEGGCLICDDSSNPPMLKTDKDWTVGSTGSNPIHWLIWDGCLISTEPVAQAQLRNLADLFPNSETLIKPNHVEANNEKE